MKTIPCYLATCFIGLFLLVGCVSPAHHGGRWEYKVIEEYNYAGKLEPKLNELAKEGWSIVSSSTILSHDAGNALTQVILKRPQHR